MAEATRFASILAILIVALMAWPAVAHTGATKMLKDAAVDHDLAQARRYFERIVEKPRSQTLPHINDAPSLSR
jgi:hypothetical protein